MAADPLATAPIITIGIDVGGRLKGFHAVALRDGAYAAQLSSRDVEELSHWCRSVIGASVIAIDAPCRWSSDGRMRPCERALMRQGIFLLRNPQPREGRTASQRLLRLDAPWG